MTAAQFTLGAMLAVAGLGIPVMAGMNAAVGARIGAPFAAVAVLACVLLAVSAAASFVFESPAASAVQSVPKAYLAAGVLFFFYISTITIGAPRIGIGNAIVLVLLGQVTSAVAIDHFGLFGAAQLPISGRRIFGLTLLLSGIYLARN